METERLRTQEGNEQDGKSRRKQEANSIFCLQTGLPACPPARLSYGSFSDGLNAMCAKMPVDN